MNSIEAVKLAFEGKKVRRKKWYFANKDKCVHIFASNYDTGLRQECALKTDYCKDDKSTEYTVFLPEDVLANDWEVL